MRRTSSAVVVGVFVCAAAARAQTPPTPDSLAAISERGRLLAQYDYAAWHATDSVMARRPAAGVVQGYVARRLGDERWTVAFGRLSPARDAFYVAYEITQRGTAPGAFDVREISPARADTGYYLRAMRAIAVAGADFGRQPRPYNPAVLERPDGGFWVYLMPAQTRAGVFPLGADVRYTVSTDGRRILVRRRLHRALMEVGPPPEEKGHRAEASMHAHFLSDVPEDTDVLHVLVRETSLPEYITSEKFMYRLDHDGTIHLLGRTQDVLGKDGKLALPPGGRP